jgi:hypothetical protein
MARTPMRTQEATIKNLLENCSKEVFDMIAAHCEDIPWKFCALSELMLRLPHWWLGGTMTLGVPSPAATLPNEPSIEINWALPLNESGQKHLFTRIFQDYSADTSMVDLGSKRKYRKTEKDLTALRILAGFWQQASAFCKSQMMFELYAKFEEDLFTTMRRDDELAAVIEVRSSRFAISQLKSFREMAIKGKAQEDRMRVDSMALQFLELREKQFEYFEAGLKADWQMLDKVRGAMAILEDVLHIKKVRWLRDLANKGEEEVAKHMNRYLSVDGAPNVDEAMKSVLAMIKLMQLEDGTKDVMVIGIVDFNVPHSTDKEALDTYCILTSRLHWGRESNTKLFDFVRNLPWLPQHNSISHVVWCPRPALFTNGKAVN